MFPVPANEADRMAAVARFRPLREPNTLIFDYIARLAAQHFNVPMALVSVVDKKDQWFAGRKGVTLTGTPREIAFCAHVIMADEVMVVEDARKDPRFAFSPLVTGAPFIRFYAGAPLIIEADIRIGALCIMDRVPKSLTVGQTIVLRHMAQIAISEMKLRATA